MRSALGPDPAAGAIARRLAAPPGLAFVALPLPPDGGTGNSAPTGLPVVPAAPVPGEPPAPADDPWLGQGAASAALAPPASAASLAGAASPGNAPTRSSTLRLPTGFKPLRAWHQGKKAAVFGLSEDYDPSMTVSAGGYWVLLSDAAGRAWQQALYTGLRENLPYTVVPSSKLPLVSGSHLQIEVEIKELADPLPQDVQYAPADLVPRKAQTGLYLDIPIRALLLDSDGDGLTDLAERRLLTDPQERDSDGDGVLDGEDSTPTIPTSDLPAPEAGVLAEALTAMIGTTPDPRARISCCPGLLPRSFAEKTVFVVGERPWFAGLVPAYRLVVLTREELQALGRQEPQPFWPSIDLLVLDRARHRALVVWSRGNTGGTLLLDEQSGGWHPAVSSRWYT
jgi:hypothetical protein